MSRSPLEIVQRGLELFTRGEFEASVELLAPEFEWDTSTAVPDGGVHRGREEVLAYWRSIGERWEGFRIEPVEWRQGDGVVVMLGRLRGRGAGSGVPIEGTWDQVWRVREGCPVRCENYTDRAATLRAAGLDSGY